MPVPVHIVSGFLGAGKTTALLDQIARRPDERIAVLVNDFGDAAIDQQVVGEGDTVALTEIRGACVCCTAPEGFTDALGMLLDDVRPDRIFIEPTGLARPADLVDTVQRGPHRDKVALGPVVVLVDPRTFDPSAGDTAHVARDQVEAADVLVANRVDLATEAEVARFEAWAGQRWPAPLAVYRTTFGKLPAGALEWPEGEGPRRAGHDHDHDHDHDDGAGKGVAARTWIWDPEARFDRGRLADLLARLAGGQAGAPLVRAKGLFQTLEGTWLLEVAGGTYHERPSGYRRDSRVDLMFAGGAEDALDTAAAWLEATLCTQEELHVDPEQVEVVRPDGTRLILDRSALLALPDPVADITPLVPGRRGAAARVRALLERVGVTGAADVVVIAADGYATPPVPVEALYPGLLLHSIDGGPLGADKGGPFRLLIPGDAGPGGPCANVKGVVRIVFRPGA